MARLRLQLPDLFSFRTTIAVRISDINYGNHLGNDAYLALMHEARMQYFQSMGFTEMNIGGASVIMADSAIVYKAECRYGDNLQIEVTAAELSGKSFDLYYRFTRLQDHLIVCEAKTRMVSYNYELKQSVAVPESFRSATGITE